MARLTVAEKRLLQHPPTKGTWRCKGYIKTSPTEGEVEKKLCGQLNLGLTHHCWVCGKVKPNKAELVWPEYVAACKKAGIEPGERWHESDPPKAAARRNVRRKGN